MKRTQVALFGEMCAEPLFDWPQAFEKHTVTLLPVVNKPVNQQ